MNYLDLFSGCGGFRLGLEKAGITPAHEYHCEIDKYADQVYCKHYPQSENLGDINNVKTNGTIHGNKINLVTFGFPCQDLSVAGKGQGLEGERSGLFYEATRLIRELKPDVFIFENVKGLLSSKGGADFTAVLREIADIGLYECQWQLVNTRWVLPQNRERIFFVGCLAGSGASGRQIFPITETDRFCNAGKREEIQQDNEAWTLKARDYASWRGNHVLKQLNDKACQSQRVYSSDGISSNLNAGSGGGGAKTGLYAVPLRQVRSEEAKEIRRVFEERTDDIANCLTTSDVRDKLIKHGVYDGHAIRRLTPIECARLQGFPDNWHDGVSDTQAYKMYGNAVTADIAQMVFDRVYNEKTPTQ